MILAIDPGLQFIGWAVAEHGTARIRDMGLIETKLDDAIGRSTDRARRIARTCLELRHVADQHDADMIAAEGMLFHGRTNAVVANVLPWGGLIGLAVAMRMDLVEVSAKAWQLETLGLKKGPVPYDELLAMLDDYASHQLGARIEAFPKSKRMHVLCAVGVALYAGLTRAHAVMVHKAEAVA